MTTESPSPATPDTPARTHAPAILGGVSAKFQQPLEDLKILEETCDPMEDKPGEYTVLVLAKNFKMYGVHFQTDADGKLMSLACEEISDVFNEDTAV